MPAREQSRPAAGCLDALVVAAAMSESQQSAWCRAQGLYPGELAHWRQETIEALAEAGEAKSGSRRNARRRRSIVRPGVPVDDQTALNG